MKELAGFAAGLLIIAALLFFRSSFSGDGREDHSSAGASFPDFKPEQVDPSQTSLFIDKSDYRLYLLEAEDTLKWYPVVFGFNPVDDKMQEGDGCTPEGRFQLRSMYEHQKWERFLWIDYPTKESWKKFEARKSAGIIPEDASIGGEIGIHGVPSGY